MGTGGQCECCRNICVWILSSCKKCKANKRDKIEKRHNAHTHTHMPRRGEGWGAFQGPSGCAVIVTVLLKYLQSVRLAPALATPPLATPRLTRHNKLASRFVLLTGFWIITHKGPQSLSQAAPKEDSTRKPNQTVIEIEMETQELRPAQSKEHEGTTNLTKCILVSVCVCEDVCVRVYGCMRAFYATHHNCAHKFNAPNNTQDKCNAYLSWLHRTLAAKFTRSFLFSEQRRKYAERAQWGKTVKLRFEELFKELKVQVRKYIYNKCA